MSLEPVRQSAVVFIIVALASALIELAGGSNLSNLPTANLNIVSPPVSSPEPYLANNLEISCLGSRYGANLHYDACLDAFSTFARGQARTPVRIGRRSHGEWNNAVNLPWRWVSRDGRCAFDFVIRGRADFDTTTGADIARAAWKLMNECVRDQGGQGGMLSNLGSRPNPHQVRSCHA